jgi:hypothetical protein
VRDNTELCDDGGANSNTVPNACRTTCQRNACGDGIVDAHEECDGEQSCSVDCKLVACGNGRVDEGEECEPPGAGACGSACQLLMCGNGRLDTGEECEPPGAGSCSAECRTIACGDGRVDTGEECDPPVAGSCSSSCLAVACGNGEVEEGEGCDPPAAGTCDAECRTLGCGDGQVSGSEECDPPAAGSCTGACLRISCGNARVDDGEQCDPPAAGSCDASCRTIRCGDGKTDAGETCDPPAWGQCTSACQRIVCGDGRLDAGEQCEPSGAFDPTCTSNCTAVDVTGSEYLFTFDSDLQGWQLYATSPDRLKSQTSVRFDGQNGDRSPGVLVMEAPFDASNQKIEVQTSLNTRDMRGRTIRARVRLGSGLSSDQEYPGGIKLFAKAGADYGYASGAWTYLRPGEGWVDVTLDCNAPVLIPNEFDPSEVHQIGVELRTFSETRQVSPAIVYLDSISF